MDALQQLAQLMRCRDPAPRASRCAIAKVKDAARCTHERRKTRSDAEIGSSGLRSLVAPRRKNWA